MRSHMLALSVAAWLATGCSGATDPDSGLSLECIIPTDQIFAGGPGRDGIPALDLPFLTDVAGAFFMADEHRVLGVEIDGVARAYPLIVMWWHEIVNDTIAGANVVVSYCPLTGSGLAFDAFVDGAFRVFGVSGLLFENNLMMFDRQTESIWNQLLMGAQCGPESGKLLTRLPVVETTWKQWRTAHPQTTVLTLDTGFDRAYGAYPYGDYNLLDNAATFFPSSTFSDARPPKELVLGIREGNAAVAYPFGVLADKGDAVAVNDQVGGRSVLVTYLFSQATDRAFDRNVAGQTLSFTVASENPFTLTDNETGSTWDWSGGAIAGPLQGERLTPLEDAWTMFWFAWSVFYPETQIVT